MSVVLPQGLAQHECWFSEGTHIQMPSCLEAEQIADKRQTCARTKEYKKEQSNLLQRWFDTKERECTALVV